MTINFNGINNSLKQDQKILEKNTGNLGGRFVKVLKQTLEHIRNNHLLSSTTFVVSNIAFAITAEKILVMIFKSSRKMKDVHILSILIGIPLATLTSLNTALYLALKPRLHPVAAAGISLVAFSSTFMTAFLLDMRKNAKAKHASVVGETL